MDEFFSKASINLTSLSEERSVDEFQQFLLEPLMIAYRLDSVDERRGFHYSFDHDKAAYVHELGHKENYVVVYLAFITEEEEAGKSYSFDLVTPFGLNNYLRYLGRSQDESINSRIATFIQIRNLRTSQVLEEKRYYLLKLDSLDKKRLSGKESALYMSVYDYSDLRAGDSAMPQLQPLNGLMGLVYKGKSLPNPQIPQFPKGRLKVQVNNVGQGNWNEIRTRNRTRVVYDIGTYIHKYSRDTYVETLITSHQYTRKPSLIISHWDLDHYNCLLFMTPKERKQFSQLIVTTTLPSLTPFRLLQYYVIKTKVQVSLIDNGSPLLKSITNYIDVSNPLLKLFACPMKMGTSKFYTNESGLLLDVDAKEKNILLTGDCTYDQASEAVRQSYVHINQDKDHYLVAPHHGGGHNPDYKLPQHCVLKAAIISVDELKRYKTGKVVRHRYGHPTNEVVYHFVKKHTCQLVRTDYANDDILI